MRVLVVADIRVTREELARAMARADPGMDVSAATCGPEVTGRIALRYVDVLIVDMTADRALTVVQHVAARQPDVKIVALAAPEDGGVIRCAEAGVSAFLPADSSIDDVLTAIHAVEQGDSFCPPGVAAALLLRLRELGRAAASDTSPLTARELEITRLIDLGFTNKGIARELSIAPSTVKNHVHHILKKLGVERRADAAARIRGGS
jgi:two-component system, NarL family, nitrate/nitrite response regulator NarL